MALSFSQRRVRLWSIRSRNRKVRRKATAVVQESSPDLTHTDRQWMQSFQLLLYRDAQAADAFADLIGLGRGKIQPQVATALFEVAVRGIEAIPGDEGHVLANGYLEQLLRVDA